MTDLFLTEVKYVNVHGQPVDLNRLPRAKPKAKQPNLKRVTERSEAKEHHGFELVGVPVERLRAAKIEHGIAAELAAEAGKPKPAEFSESAWLAKQKPKRAVRRIFYVPEAADQAAQIAQASGEWLFVRVVEILKG